MNGIHIALQEGFDNDTVRIYLNGVEIFNKEGVKTRMQIGLADKVEHSAIEGSNELRIEVVNRRAEVKMSVVVEDNRTLYIGVSRRDDNIISSKLSNEPFRYA